MTAYLFLTRWSVRAPLEKVWDAIYHSERWPQWWRGVEEAQEIRAASGPYGVGSVRRFTWKSRLPYRLTFELAVTRVDPLSRIESTAAGELEGTGIWSFAQDGPFVRVRYRWDVRTTKPWMNAVAPLARPFFRWNHDIIMAWGFQGLQKWLQAVQS